MKNILMTIVLLSLPVSAYAGWSDNGSHPMMAPNMDPQQRQGAHYDQGAKIIQRQRIEPQEHIQAPRPQQHYVPSDRDHRQVQSYDQDRARHDDRAPGYFRRDVDYYGYAAPVLYQIADVTPSFVVPYGFEALIVNGETFYYNQGAFYQLVGNTLETIPAVLGAIVDNIPQDYQIITTDNGAHYLYTSGVYYQRVDQGFMVVQAPV